MQLFHKSIKIKRNRFFNKMVRSEFRRFNCEVCDFISSKLSEYNRHIITKKHQIQTGQIQQNKKSATNKKPKIQHGGYYICDCGNKYKHYSSLWNHCRKCGAKNIDSINHSIDPINITNKDPILDNTNIRNTKDDIIEKLLSELQEERAEKTEMKSMFMLIMEISRNCKRESRVSK